MSGHQEVTYTMDFGAGRQGGRDHKTLSSDQQPRGSEAAGPSIPRIARLMALAIRLEGLLRDEKSLDYAELARLGQGTRARITQIMKLLHLAPRRSARMTHLCSVRVTHSKNTSCPCLPVGKKE